MHKSSIRTGDGSPHKYRYWYVAIAWAVAAFFLLGKVGAAAGDPAAGDPAASVGLRPVADRTLPPDFALTDASGAPVRLSAYKGHVVLLDFWATWCTGCKLEIPWYMAFQKKYERQGLTSIGVAMDDEGWQAVRPYLAMHPFNYPIVLGSPGLVKPYQITSLPVTLLIDRNGRVADTHVGVVAKDAWEQEIRRLVKEAPTNHR
jgi:thiol-disulfide isomerase/thioredoxin